MERNKTITFGNISSMGGLSAERQSVSNQKSLQSGNNFINEYMEPPTKPQYQRTSLLKMDSAEKPLETVFDSTVSQEHEGYT